MDQLFEKIHQLPNVPEVVMELIENFNNRNISVDEVASSIKKDPNLALKVLRMANSARYGAGRNIGSIDDAVMLLGFDCVKTLVIASGVTCAFKEIPGLDRREFWRESFMVANIARTIVRNSKIKDVSAETAFTCGILHNIGLTLMHIGHPDKMLRIDKLVEQGALRSELELNQFGYDYTQVGAELARRWRFPETIRTALEFQNHPLDTSPFSAYAAAVHLSAYLYRCIVNGKSEEEALGQFPVDVRKPLSLDLLTLYEDIVELMHQDDDIDTILA
ncbi:HDOD domain-containing protein [Larsenimonas rhizosphaerae]|uniref:HDOD domain-containing protein n=1 Tax=Larsenimonas rhizosphaerae TaxID=2944682 RepID=A0AA41ZGM6_9GAMM|nr:HDOD domain-containing protein [Larsenimonas rhizosphaerae]MCM2129638.1 HDOD domain-containing protein [Larsenimonas rhizosphaerae]MCX2524296.1 HDOD domain-containing protein [Larsenimonas rhizosphaerae]